MLKANEVYSSFSVDNLEKARKFYSENFGLKVEKSEMGLNFNLPHGGMVFVYQKDNHQPATYTVLNFDVDDIDDAVNELKSMGVKFEYYGGMTDKNGIARGMPDGNGPNIAWFKDPSGNILSVLQNT